MGRLVDLGHHQQWQDGVASTDPTPMEEVAPLGEGAFLRRAVHRSEEMFPPDRLGAREDLAGALAASPLRSQTWFHHARNELFSGRREYATAAISRADALDPWYPGQRLRSIQFWYLLGERDRAVDLAARMADMGPRQRRDAARELIVMGIEPTEVWSLIVDERLPAGEAGKLLLAMGAVDASGMRTLVGNLQPEYLDDDVYRGDIFRRASNPYLPEILVHVWNHGHGPLLGLPAVPLENPALDTPPFRVGLPVGWQPPPTRDVYTVSWITPELTAGISGGLLRVELPPGATSATWNFYRTLLTEEISEPKFFTLRVRSESMSQVWLTIRSAAGTVRFSAIRLAGEWETLVVPIPEGTAGFVDLVLDIRPPSESGRQATIVEVGELGVGISP